MEFQCSALLCVRATFVGRTTSISDVYHENIGDAIPQLAIASDPYSAKIVMQTQSKIHLGVADIYFFPPRSLTLREWIGLLHST